MSGCTLLDCSACRHVGCNQQALHSLQSLLSGATPVGHAKWHTLTDHLPHNSSGLRVQEVRQKLWGLPPTKLCNTHTHSDTHTHTHTHTPHTHTHTYTHTHTTHFVLLDPVSQVTGLYSESLSLGAFAIVVSDLPHRPHLHQAVQREVTRLYSLGTSTVNQERTNVRALLSNLSSNIT